MAIGIVPENSRNPLVAEIADRAETGEIVPEGEHPQEKRNGTEPRERHGDLTTRERASQAFTDHEIAEHRSDQNDLGSMSEGESEEAAGQARYESDQREIERPQLPDHRNTEIQLPRTEKNQAAPDPGAEEHV